MISLFMEIEFGTPDFDQAVHLREQILRVPLGLRFEPSDIIMDYLEWHFGLFQQGHLLACLTLRPLDKHTVKMRQVAVLKQLQGKGLGKLLVTESEKWLKSQTSVSSIELNARKTALAFYLGLAYEKVGYEFKEVGIAHYKMTKKIS